MTHVRFRMARWLALALFTIAGLPAIASAQDAARLTAPAAGGSDVEPRVTFTWNAVSGALAYYLYVGTTPGAKDVVNTGEIQATQYLALNLSGGTIFHARLHTKFASGWKSTDISFTTRAVSMLTSPRDQAVNVERRPTFQWTPVAGASAYYLYVGTTPGAKDVVNTGELQSLSFKPAAPLPASRTLYARTHARFNGAWRHTETTFTTVAAALIVSPADAAVDVDTLQALTWSTVEGAQAYYLYVGTTPGAKDLIDTGETLATSRSISSLPGGKTVFARLHTKYEGSWRFTEISFTTRGVAQFLEPRHGAANVSANQVATWTTVQGAAAYYLTAGSSPGGREYIDTGEIQANSYPLGALPPGMTVHLRLYTRLNSIWKSVDATIATDSSARIFTPHSGSTDVARHSQIMWSSTPGATAYYLYVGSTPGAKDLINTGEIQATSYPADSLPSGQTVYARIWTRLANQWRFSDATFTMRASAVLTGNWSGEVDPGGSATWQPVAGADRYYLYVGSTPGAKDLIDSFELASPNYSLVGVPGGRTVFLRLFTRAGGVWRYEDYTLTTAPLSYLVTPVNQAVEVELEQLSLTWAAVDGASAYRIQLGQSHGASDVWVSPELVQNTIDAPPLPGGRTLYARVSARHGGIWRSTDAQFMGKAISQLKYPVATSTNADLSQPFQWTSVAGASAYSLQVGSVPGGADLADSGPVTATTRSVLNLPAGSPLYVRLGTRIGSVWRYRNSVVRVGGVMPPAMVYPATDGAAVDASIPFEWVRDPLAESYRLRIGTSPGAADVHDSGSVRVQRRFVSTLPLGQTLHGTLTASYLDAPSVSKTFSFEVASAAIPLDAQIDVAKWATGLARSMAGGDNVAYGNTMLADTRRSEGKLNANCVTFALTTLAILQESAVAAPARPLNICLNINTFDCHTLVELFDSASNRWIMLDPTFALTVRRATDGGYADSAEVSAVARSMTWAALDYEFLTPAGDNFARDYPLDYATMFVNVYMPGSPSLMQDPPATILPYYELVGSSVSAAFGYYAMQCAVGQTAVNVLVNGALKQEACSSSDRLTRIFGASSLAAPAGAQALTIYRARRFKF